MRGSGWIVVLVCLLVVVFAPDSPACMLRVFTGREDPQEIAAKEGGHHWFLITENGEYELHLGPGRFRAAQGFKMSEGDEAETTGFVHEDHMAPITLTVKGKTIALRTDEGRPLWAGTEFGGKDREEGDELPDRPERPERGERRGQGGGRNRE